jgi:hypothetical protein
MKTQRTRARKTKRPVGAALPNRGVISVWGILALAAGVLLTASFLMTANKLIGAGSWVETPCETTVEEGAGRRGKSRKFREKTRVVFYRWQWGGKWFQSSTLQFPGFFGENPEPGSELTRAPVKSALTDTAHEGESRCFVNPQDPSQAVLDPGMDGIAKLIYLVGMTGFPYLGLLAMLAVFVEHPRRVKDLAARARNPNTPFLWRDDWERGVIEDRRQSVRMIAQYALFWTCPAAAAIAATGFFARDASFGNTLTAGVAALVSLVAAGMGIFRGSNQFDRLVFVPSSFPPLAGYQLQGTIKLPRRLRKRATVTGLISVTRLLQTSRDGLQPVPLTCAPVDLFVEGRELTATVALPWAPPASPYGTHLPVTWTLALVAAGDSLTAAFELPVAAADSKV